MHSSAPRLALALTLVVVACGPPPPPEGDLSDAAVPPTLDERAQLVAMLERGEPAVVLLVEGEAEPVAPGVAASALSSPARAGVRAIVPDHDVLFEGVALPIVGVRVRDVAQLDALERLPGVVHVEPDRAHEASAAAHLELIGQPAALARGADGRGLSVAVLDTGVDYTRPELGACSAPGGACPVAFARDFAPEDGALDGSSRHGTNVAGIIHLVAPSARILALDVFSGATASSLDIAEAIDWILVNRDTYAIVAANLSLGYGAFTSPCGTDVLAVAMGRLREGGVVPVAAAGNSGYTNAISSPACAPAAVSVGAVDSSGSIASFSSSASFLSILAPGVSITAAGVTMSGTSQATPHVAASVAAIRSAYAADGVTETIARLVGTGVPTRDPRNGVTTPRLSLDAATAGGATAPPPDVSPPTGLLTLDGPYVRSTRVAYTLSASDASPVTHMCLGSSTTCTTFVPFAASGTVTLPAGDGTKTLRAWLRDASGNTSSTPLVATTILDTRAPSAGRLEVRAGVGALTLTPSGVTETGSGIDRYRVMVSTTSATPAAGCASGTPLVESSAPPIALVGLTVGVVHRVRVCAIDRAGNVSSGALTSGTPAAELDPPTGSIVIEGGATWARASRVAVTVAAEDASGVTSVCFATTPAACTAWVGYRPVLSASLASGAGDRALYAWLRDRWGNATSSPVSDGVRVDPTPPPDPVVSASAETGALVLSWPAVVDPPGGSGLAGYLVAVAAGTRAPTTCTGATLVAASPHRVSGLVDGRTYSYRVCATDVAGHVSRGRTGSAVPRPESAWPSAGSIEIAGGAAWTRTTLVSVALSASDASGVASVCLSTTASCTAWRAYAPTTSFSLPAGTGLRTLRAWFRDPFGNATPAPVLDTIAIDTQAPPSPRVTATARSGGVTLTFTAVADIGSGSGLAGYHVATGTGASAPPCASGVSIAPTAPRASSIDAPAGTRVRWRVCAFDALGNESAGATGATVAAP